MATQVVAKNKTFLIPEPGDPCELWRGYYTGLKKEVGAENARRIWLITWSKNGSPACTTSAQFNRFLRQNQIDVSSAATRAVADISAMGGNILGLGKTLTKVISIGVPVVLTGVLIGIVFMLIKTAKKADITDLSTLTPVGRAAKLSGITRTLKR